LSKDISQNSIILYDDFLNSFDKKMFSKDKAA